ERWGRDHGVLSGGKALLIRRDRFDELGGCNPGAPDNSIVTDLVTRLQRKDPPSVAPHRYDASIVIPLFNNVELTQQCLESIAEHTPADRYEVILVDNASTDGTPGLCQALGGDVKVV